MISFQDARKPFDIRFYLVAILFVMFDIEITLLMPWAVSIKSVGLYGYFSFMLFIFILAVGFIYEWKKGVLEWK
jgi:NADH-quinone oxidoreductase subunit A